MQKMYIKLYGTENMLCRGTKGRKIVWHNKFTFPISLYNTLKPKILKHLVAPITHQISQNHNFLKLIIYMCNIKTFYKQILQRDLKTYVYIIHSNILSRYSNWLYFNIKLSKILNIGKLPRNRQKQLCHKWFQCWKWHFSNQILT